MHFFLVHISLSQCVRGPKLDKSEIEVINVVQGLHGV
jgi:hypothetical protein